MELFHGTGLGSMMQGVLGAEGREGRDGLFATLGVTGSGKVCRKRKCETQESAKELTVRRATQSWDLVHSVD